MSLINTFISLIMILISVAFYTLLERKILSYIQMRKGPNKTSMLGILQPISDAIKLFNKNLILIENSNMIMFLFTPLLCLILAMSLLLIIPFFSYSNFDNKHNMIMFFIISSMNVYILLMIGWASNSKYAHMGAIRSIAQMISYEVALFLIILFILIMASSYNFTQISEIQMFNWNITNNLIMFFMWSISCLAEVNRSPFDFSEGESELVSGFNVEYMGGMFALIFLAEYMNMIILSMITIILFFFKLNMILSMFFLSMILISMLWIRGSYPRFRYDLLMNLSWKLILPSILFLLIWPITFMMWNV